MEVRNVRKRRKKQKTKFKVHSMIGAIIDMPLEEFKEELVKQKTNVGTMRNLIVYFNSIYADLKTRKDGIMNLVIKEGHSKDEPEIKNALNGLYAEMVKIEEKTVYLNQRVKELIDVGVD